VNARFTAAQIAQGLADGAITAQPYSTISRIRR
jgi:hypothetical protein